MEDASEKRFVGLLTDGSGPGPGPDGASSSSAVAGTGNGTGTGTGAGAGKAIRASSYFTSTGPVVVSATMEDNLSSGPKADVFTVSARSSATTAAAAPLQPGPPSSAQSGRPMSGTMVIPSAAQTQGVRLAPGPVSAPSSVGGVVAGAAILAGSSTPPRDLTASSSSSTPFSSASSDLDKEKTGQTQTIRFTTTVVRGEHGIGLDLGKTVAGMSIVQRLKEMPPGVVNPASICYPPIKAGDRIIGVNGKACELFTDVVREIKAAEGTIEISFERST